MNARHEELCSHCGQPVPQAPDYLREGLREDVAWVDWLLLGALAVAGLVWLLAGWRRGKALTDLERADLAAKNDLPCPRFEPIHPDDPHRCPASE